MDVVAIAQAPELLLAGRVPHVELDGSSVGMEDERVHLHTEGGYILLKLTRQVVLHEGCLPGAAVAHQDELDSRDEAAA